MSWKQILKDDVDEAIDELEEIVEEFDLEEHEWESVDDASDYLFEHKVKKNINELTDDVFELLRKAKTHAQGLDVRERSKFEKRVIFPLEKIFSFLRR